MARRILTLLTLSLVFSFSPLILTAAEGEVVVYCGRSKNLVQPVVKLFEEATSIRVRVRYGNTAQLAVTLLEEGKKSPADVYWAQDAGALGAVSRGGLFLDGLPNRLDPKVTKGIPRNLRSKTGQWVAISGRARVLAYAPKRVTAAELPASVFDLVDSKWRGRVGWAPTNGSFQTFVTAMRVQVGDEKTLRWLVAMKNNDAKRYPKNTPIIQALAASEIDVGLPNHYYLFRFKKKDPNFPVAQQFFANPGDAGNLINIAGVGVLKSSQRQKNAIRFVEFLLSAPAQKHFTQEVSEYPMTNTAEPKSELVPLDELDRAAPRIDLDALTDLEGTLKLLQQAGLL